jgi:hypothetical protein
MSGSATAMRSARAVKVRFMICLSFVHSGCGGCLPDNRSGRCGGEKLKQLDETILQIAGIVMETGLPAGGDNQKRDKTGRSTIGTGGVLQDVTSKARKIENVVFGGHALPAFEHALGGTVMKRAGDQFAVHDLQQKAPAVHADGINAVPAVGVEGCSTMAAIGF